MAKLTKVNGTRGLFRTATGHFVIDKMVKGQRLYRNLDAVALDSARRMTALLVAEAVEREVLPGKSRGSLTLSVTDALNTFWTDRLQYLKSAKMEKNILDRLCDTIGSVQVRTLTAATIEQVKTKMLATKSQYDRPLSARYVNLNLQLLSRALNWCAKCRIIPSNPIAGYIPAEQATPKKIIFDEGYDNGPEWLALLAALPADTQPVATLLYETAMRPAEAFALRWEWIKEIAEDRWLIVIPPAIEKTGAERKIPVSRKLLDVLKPMRKDDGLVFPSYRTGEARLTISKAFSAAMIRAKLMREGLSPYALRRTRITIWDEIDGNACRYAVGHTFSDVHSRHYRDFTPERLFRLVDLPFDHREQFKVVASA